MFSCEYCEIFKNTFYTEHARATASWLNLKMFLKDYRQNVSLFCLVKDAFYVCLRFELNLIQKLPQLQSHSQCF